MRFDAGEYRPFGNVHKNRRFWRILDRAARRHGLTVGRAMHFDPNLDAVFLNIKAGSTVDPMVGYLTGLEIVQSLPSAPRLARCIVARIEGKYGRQGQEGG